MGKFKKIFWLLVYMILLVGSVALLYFTKFFEIGNFLCGALFGFSLCKIFSTALKKEN